MSFENNRNTSRHSSDSSILYSAGVDMSNEGRGDPMVRAQGRSKPDRSWYPEDFDWYLKWVASIVVLCSLAMRAAGPEYRMLDIYFGWFGIGLWIWVSVIWRDRALIMLNVVSWFMLTVAILKEWV